VTGPDAAAETGGETARLFVALPVPTAVRQRLEPVVAPVRRRADELTWTRPEGWHLTVAFLGRVAVDRLDEVVAAVRAGAGGTPPVRLVLGAPGRFGPRVLWIDVGAEPEDALLVLGERIQVAVAAAELPVERRRVRPHLTLARGGRGRPVRAGHLDELTSALEGAPAVASSTWVADEVQLWRTQPTRGPARYQVETAVPLGG
jgi:RNA 2',3'-cyclic 3'-phosphodiesterase